MSKNKFNQIDQSMITEKNKLLEKTVADNIRKRQIKNASRGMMKLVWSKLINT